MNEETKDSQYTVCVLEPIHKQALDLLRTQVRLITPEDPASQHWIELADAIIVRTRIISRADIAAAKKLKVIGKHGAGTDNIDTAAANDYDVKVVSTPGVNAPSVADLAVAMALSLIRNLNGHTRALRDGTPLMHHQRIGYEVSELPVGIIGLGAIGKLVATRLKNGFGATVTAFDPGVPSEGWPLDIARADTVEELLFKSKLLFLHVGLNDATRGMISTKQLNSMPDGAFVVNCARGGVVNEAALAEALASGKIAGAASDVFEQEPPAPDHPLLQQPNFIATPHIGASTEAGLLRTGEEVVNKILSELDISVRMSQ